MKSAKGYVHLVKIKKGGTFITEFGTSGIYLESSPTSSKVIVINCPHANTEEDKRYYLGMQKWSPNTDVRRT